MIKAKANILIVEDEWIVAEDIKSSLKNLGYRVADIVSSGEKVIAKVEEHNPDLVLMDIMLKGQMDGIEAASRIHSQFDIPIVYLTAYTDEKLLERAKITEPYGYIVKPFENRELSTAVEIALYKHNVEKQLKDAYIRLDKKKDLLEKIFSTSYGLIAYMDREFNFIRVNRAYAEADNQTQDFFPGKNHFDLYPDKENEAIFRNVVDTGEAYTAYAKPFEYAEHPERAVSYWDWHLVPSTNHKGEVDGLVFTLEDVTERVKTEKALKESQKELKSLFNNMQDTFYRADADGRMTMISPSSSELVQYTPEELVGQRLADFYVDPNGREKFIKALEEGGGRIQGYEAAVRRKDGDEVWVSTNAHIYFDESGNPAGVEGAIRDITDRRSVEEEIRRANRALKAIDRCRHALIHIDDEGDLLEAVCGIISSEAAYDLVWVGFAENDRTKTVRPVARAGDKKEYLDHIEVRWSDTRLGRGPVGTSIRTGKPSVINEAVSESRFNPCNSSSRRFGLKSIVGFPLIIEKEPIGALTIYSSEYNAFDKNEIELLEGLANDLAYGIKSLRGERKRREAEEKLRSLQKALETTNMGVTIADMEGKILYVNPADAEMHGYSTEDLIGKDVRIFSPPELYKKLNLKQLVNTKNRRRESFNISKKGTVFPVNLISDIVSDALGKPVGIVTTCEDISDRKASEKALRVSEERYALAMSGANDGLWDRDLITGEVYFSPRWKEMLGYKDDEIPNKHKEWEKRVHPDDIDNIDRAKKEYFEGRTPDYVIEYRMKHRDGLYRWILTKGAMMRDAEGKLVRFAGSHTDITERKRMEETLLGQLGFINNTIESLPYPFMVIGAADYTIKLANSAASGHLGDKGLTCHKLLYNKRKPPGDKGLICPLKEVKRTRKPVKVEHVRKNKNGDKQYIEAHGYPIFDNDKNLIQMILYTIDITDRKKAEEELKASHEKLRSLAGHIESAREEERTAVARDIHDELGQVLTACKFDVSWTAGKLGPDQKNLFERLDAASGHIDGAIQTVKKIATELRPTLLDDLGLTAAIEWQSEEFERRTGIESNLLFEPWNVLLGKEISTAVFRLFQEALTNVARHSGATKVYASLKGNDGHLVLEIVDNGKGIAKKDMSATKSFGLLGMRERVFALGGEIDISGIEGEGTKVIAMIPLHNNHN